ETLDANDARRESVGRVVAELDLELRRRAPPIAAPTPPPRPPPPWPPPRSYKTPRIAAIVLLFVGGALAIVGGAFVGVAVADDRLLANPPRGWVYDPRVASQRDTLYPAGLSLLGIGGASLAAGAGVLIYSERGRAAARAQPGAALRFMF